MQKRKPKPKAGRAGASSRGRRRASGRARRRPEDEFYQMALRRLNRQRAQGRLPIPVDDIRKDETLRHLLATVEPGDEVRATCMTDMDAFWCTESGSHYLRFNHELLKRGVRIERIFDVDSRNWREQDKKKREVIKVLQGLGCKCRAVHFDARQREEAKGEDYFLLFRRESPRWGLTWNLDPFGNTQMLTVLRNKEDLKNKALNYRSLRDRISTKDLPEDPLLEGILKFDNINLACKYLSHFVPRFQSVNGLRYLHEPEEDALDSARIAAYWDGLRESIVRPSRKTCLWIKTELERHSRERALERIAVLGCTPEVRGAIASACPHTEVDVVDLSGLMFESMSQYLNLPHGGATLGPAASTWPRSVERHIERHWLALESEQYDAVIGIDVLNMVSSASAMRDMLESMGSSLKADGVVLLQTLTWEPDYVERVLRARARNLGQRLASMPEDHRGSHNAVAEMAFVLGVECDDGCLRTSLRQTADSMVNWAVDNRIIDFVNTHYQYCNTTLTLPTHAQLTKMCAEYFKDVTGPIPATEAGRRDFTADMHMLRLAQFRGGSNR